MCTDRAARVSAVYHQLPSGAATGRTVSHLEQPQRTAGTASKHMEIIDLIDDDEEDQEESYVAHDAGPENALMSLEEDGASPMAGHVTDEDAPGGQPWWTILPDFVPVAALRDGRDPRCG